MSRKESRAILKRLDRARDGLFPHKTCPASRHVYIIVEGLLDPKTMLHRDLLGYDPEHMAGSIASVLEGLWKARRWMKWEELPPTRKFKYNGHWVPDLDAIAAQAMSDQQGQDAARLGGDSPASAVGTADAPNSYQDQPHER